MMIHTLRQLDPGNAPPYPGNLEANEFEAVRELVSEAGQIPIIRKIVLAWAKYHEAACARVKEETQKLRGVKDSVRDSKHPEHKMAVEDWEKTLWREDNETWTNMPKPDIDVQNLIPTNSRSRYSLREERWRR